MANARGSVKNWHPCKVTQLRDLAKTHTKQEAADEMGESYFTIKHAQKLYSIEFCHGKKGRSINVKSPLESDDFPLIRALFSDGMKMSEIAFKFECRIVDIKNAIATSVSA